MAKQQVTVPDISVTPPPETFIAAVREMKVHLYASMSGDFATISEVATVVKELGEAAEGSGVQLTRVSISTIEEEFDE